MIAGICCEEYDLRGCSSCFYSEGARKSTLKATSTAGPRRVFTLAGVSRTGFRIKEGTQILIRMYEFAVLARIAQEETQQGRLHMAVKMVVRQFN
jgi:hypothetical protein